MNDDNDPASWREIAPSARVAGAGARDEPQPVFVMGGS